LQNKLEHIAFILDGNKRWAKRNNINFKSAYKKGLENITELINNCVNLKIDYLTLFTLSSENIQRQSVISIFQIIYEEFSFFFDKIIEEKKVKINIIGSKLTLPSKILKLIEHCECETKNNNQLILNLAFNYGFKNEIRQVLEKIRDNPSIKLKSSEDINRLFLLGNMKDPDLLIRTGGNKRLSNFIMYNLTYTEIFFIDTLWPDFKLEELKSIISKYNSIKRTYGL